MTRKLYIRTFGCQMNEYDSTRTADLLARSHDLVRTDNPDEADVLLVNTCSVREKAAEKLFSQIGRWKDFKSERPGVVIGVGGCVASQEGEAIRARAPFVDLVYGPQTLHRVPDMLDAVAGGGRAVDVSFPEIEKFDRLPEPRADGATAFVSIMEGCSKYCSFCVVPYTRGEEFSRPFDDVIAEVVTLAEQGRSLIDTGVNSDQTGLSIYLRQSSKRAVSRLIAGNRRRLQQSIAACDLFVAEPLIEQDNRTRLFEQLQNHIMLKLIINSFAREFLGTLVDLDAPHESAAIDGSAKNAKF